MQNWSKFLWTWCWGFGHDVFWCRWIRKRNLFISKPNCPCSPADTRPCSDKTLCTEQAWARPPTCPAARSACRVWQVTGETRSCFQGQCCNLQVKRENRTPVRGAVTWLWPPRCLLTSLLSRRASFVSVSRLSLHVCVCVDRVPVLPAWAPPPRASSRADCLRISPTVLGKQTWRQAQC